MDDTSRFAVDFEAIVFVTKTITVEATDLDDARAKASQELRKGALGDRHWQVPKESPIRDDDGEWVPHTQEVAIPFKELSHPRVRKVTHLEP